jgi:hypothetical protein
MLEFWTIILLFVILLIGRNKYLALELKYLQVFNEYKRIKKQLAKLLNPQEKEDKPFFL